MPQRIQLRRTPGWRKPEGAVVVSRPSKWGNPWRPGSPATFWLPSMSGTGLPIGVELDMEDAVALYRRLIGGGGPGLTARLVDAAHDGRLLPRQITARVAALCRDQLRTHATGIECCLPELRGRDLACWCPLGQPCHADVLLELANG